MIEIPLDQDDAVAFPDRVAGVREAVEEALLLEDRRLRRVQVLGLAVRPERPPAESDRAAPLIAQDEEKTVAETVVRARLPVLSRLEEAGLDEQALGIGGQERPRERVPGVRRAAQRQPLRQVGGHVPFLQVLRRLVAGLAQLLLVEAVGGGERVEELLPAVVAGTAGHAARNRDAEARGERFDRLREIEPVHLPDEVDDVASGPATEAVVETLLPIHREGRRALVVEGTETLPGAPRLLQARVLADDLHDVRRAAELRHHGVGDVQVTHGE